MVQDLLLLPESLYIWPMRPQDKEEAAEKLAVHVML